MNGNRLLQMSVAVVDLVYSVDQLPSAGGSVSAQKSFVAAAGGYNALIAAKRAGMDVAYGGPHGTGLFADIVRRELGEARIPLVQAQSTEADQGSCVVIVDGRGERTFVSGDEARYLFHENLCSLVDSSNFGWVLISGYELSWIECRDVMDAWLSKLSTNSELVFDPAPIVNDIPGHILSRAISKSRWISMNLEEARALTGEKSPAAAVKSLSGRTVDGDRGAIVRCGSRGCWIADSDGSPVHVDGFSVASVDTNGAGDAHVGGVYRGIR